MKIGILGLSSPISVDTFSLAVSSAKKQNHELFIPLDPSKSYGQHKYLFSCASVEERMLALKNLLKDDSIELIIAARGGYGAIELIPQFMALRAELKASPLKRKVSVAGFSDATILLAALDGIDNIQTIHGPTFINCFSENIAPEMMQAMQSLEMMVKGSWQDYDFLRNKLFNIQQISGPPLGELKVNFSGGNLSVFSSLTGSAIFPSLEGRGLFIEEIGEKPHKIHRSLMQLKNTGALEKLSVLLLGDFIDCEHSKGLGPDYLQVIKSVFADYNYPVLSGFPAGHGKRNIPLPFGEYLNLSQNRLAKC